MVTEEERRERSQDYLTCFSTPSGKRVLMDLTKAYDKSCFDSDALVMAYKEGKRDVLLAIRHLMGMARLERQQERQTKAITE